MILTENFSSEEFGCNCGCGFDKINLNLVYCLQVLRDIHGFEIIITSGCRCMKYNMQKGGHPHSYHLIGKAVDFQTKNIDVLALTIEDWSGGFHYYKEENFIHLDISQRRRWTS